MPAGEDEIIARIRGGEIMDRLQFVRFHSGAELQDLVKRTIESELRLTGDREKSFSLAMGAKLSDKGNPYFECGSTAEAAERWQVRT